MCSALMETGIKEMMTAGRSVSFGHPSPMEQEAAPRCTLPGAPRPLGTAPLQQHTMSPRVTLCHGALVQEVPGT